MLGSECRSLTSYWSVKSNFWAEIYAKDCCCGVEWYASNHQGQALISWCRRRPLQKNKGRDTIIHLYHLSQILLFREADWWLDHTGRNLDWIKIRSMVSFLFFIEVWSQSTSNGSRRFSSFSISKCSHHCYCIYVIVLCYFFILIHEDLF